MFKRSSRAGCPRSSKTPKRMRRALLAFGLPLVLLHALTSCTQPEEAEIAQMERRIQELERQVKESRAHYERQLSDFLSSVTQSHDEELRTLRDEFDREKDAYVRTVRSLQVRLDEKERSLRDLASSPPPGVGAGSLEAEQPPNSLRPPAFTFTRPAESDNADPFPVEVRELVGLKVVVGEHESIRLVESDEEYRDSFGNKRRRVQRETYAIPEYGYQASAIFLNRAQTAQRITVRCGATSQSFLLAEDEEKRVVIGALPGAPMTVTANGKIQSFPVTFP